MKLLSWNTAGRTKIIENQYLAIQEIDPEILCLQEIQANGDEHWIKILSNNYEYIISSFDHVEERSKTGPRKFHLIIASKLPIVLKNVSFEYVPWAERLLIVELENQGLKIATTHIPPGSTNGWVKIEFFEGLYKLLTEDNLILTGDFNSPRKEFSDGRTMTWGQFLNSKGEIKVLKKREGREGQRWHDAEYNLLRGISDIGYHDYFRHLNGFEKEACSWISNVNPSYGYRFDHAIGPKNIAAGKAAYLTTFIDRKLSDHAALLLEFDL
jgi:exonuclease III